MLRGVGPRLPSAGAAPPPTGNTMTSRRLALRMPPRVCRRGARRAAGQKVSQAMDAAARLPFGGARAGCRREPAYAYAAARVRHLDVASPASGAGGSCRRMTSGGGRRGCETVRMGSGENGIKWNKRTRKYAAGYGHGAGGLVQYAGAQEGARRRRMGERRLPPVKVRASMRRYVKACAGRKVVV